MTYREPEFRRRSREKRERAESKEKRGSEKNADREEVRKIARSIQNAVEQLERHHHAHKPYWDAERRWKPWEVGGLWAAALVGLLAIVIGSLDAHEQRTVMTEQLAEMKTESDIRRYELRADFKFETKNGFEADHWNISPIYTNIGKTDALNAWGWGDIKFIELTDNSNKNGNILRNTDFSYSGSENFPRDGFLVTPGSPLILTNQTVSMEQAWEAVYGTRLPIVYGYIEYKDIFGTFYTSKFCVILIFTYNPSKNEIDLTLPQRLDLPCERRTEEPTKKKE